MDITLIGLALLFFLGHALNWFFTKTKIPDLLILVVLGYILGPVTGVLDASDFGKVGAVLSTVALVVILYEGGLHLSAKDLATSSLPAAGLSILGFLAIVGASAAVTSGFFLQPWPVGVLVGLGVGSTSSAIVIPMVKKLSINDSTKTILSLESAFTDVLTIVLFLVMVEAIVSGQFSVKEILIGIGPNTGLALIMGIGSGLIWAFFKKKFAPIITMAFAGEAWAMLTYGFIELSVENGAIGVLALGFMLANLNLLPDWLKKVVSAVPVSYRDMSILSELTFLLRTFFFIYLGVLIQFSSLTTFFLAAIISILIFVTRFFVIRFLFRPKKYTRLDTMVSVAMGPRGLACAVLATIPLQLLSSSNPLESLIRPEDAEFIQHTLFAVIPMSIAATAIFVALSENENMRAKLGKLFLAYKEDTAEIAAATDSPAQVGQGSDTDS